MWNIETLGLLFVTFLIGGFVKGAIGLGLPIVALAFLAPTLGVKAAVAIMLFPAIATNIWQALAGPALWRILRRLATFLLAACFGIWLGVVVLAAAPRELLLAMLGLMLCLYSLISLTRPQIAPPGRREGYLSPLMGGLGGVAFGMVGSFMVPGVLYLQALGLKRDELIQALGVSFVTISATLAVSLSTRDLFPRDLAVLSTISLVPVAIGLFAGRRYRHHISEARFRTLLFSALLVAGLYMIGRAIF